MKKKAIDKKYIYMREDQKCYYCGRFLMPNKVSMDHYFPKSKGGTFDLFNLVCSCKRCNNFKRSHVPEDWMEVNIKLFRQAIEDKRIVTIGGLNIKVEELLKLAEKVDRTSVSEGYMVFEGPGIQFYVKENKIFKVTM